MGSWAEFNPDGITIDLTDLAVSLGLGILTSIITAVTMTRMMIALWYHRARPKTLPI